MSREEAIKILNDIATRNVFCTLEAEPLEAFRMAIAALQEPGWTPCSEGLPESDELVLLQFTPGESFMRTGFIIGKYWYNSGLTQYGSLDDVIAWRPLPEPYKGGE